MSRSRFAITFAFASILLVGVGAGCSSSTSPGAGDDDAGALFVGAYDPGQGQFVITETDTGDVGGLRVPLLLIGRNLRVSEDEDSLSLDVSILNSGNLPLYAPGAIVISRIHPYGVFPVNYDWMGCPDGIYDPPDNIVDCEFRYDYSRLLGDDHALTPGEESQPRTWVFHIRALMGFSFQARAHFSLSPESAEIAGVFFHDENENGHRERNEPQVGGGSVLVNGPGYRDRLLPAHEDGSYSVPVREAGLYTLLAQAPPTFAPVHFTTPNPVQVIVPPGPDGLPEGPVMVQFGFANDPPPGDIQYVEFLEAPHDSIPDAPYSLGNAWLDHDVLNLPVGFSGCGPDHPFRLFMVDEFMESMPVQARLILSHDDLGELCDAYWTDTLRFTIGPIIHKYELEYGRVDPIILRFEDYGGTIHTFTWSPDPPDSTM